MTRLMLVEDRPGLFNSFRAEGLVLVPTHETREGTAIIRLAGSGILTVDLALPGHSGYRCVAALSGRASDVPILALVGCDESLRPRALRLVSVPGWPTTLALPARQFDRLIEVVRPRGRVAVRTVGFLVAGGPTHTDSWAHPDAWHAMQLAIARDTTQEHRAIA